MISSKSALMAVDFFFFLMLQVWLPTSFFHQDKAALGVSQEMHKSLWLKTTRLISHSSFGRRAFAHHQYLGLQVPGCLCKPTKLKVPGCCAGGKQFWRVLDQQLEWSGLEASYICLQLIGQQKPHGRTRPQRVQVEQPYQENTQRGGNIW